MAKQGSTSDAEMLAEAAMLREHRNRLENRMVNDHFVFIIVNIIIIIFIIILTGGCAHILTKSVHGDPNHNYCDIHNIHNIHNIHYIQGDSKYCSGDSRGAQQAAGKSVTQTEGHSRGVKDLIITP